ncbi:SprT-like family-domain-containing protein, partial [Kalaharituber pfeilii]
KRSFNKRKHALAAAFLHDLDAAVTNGALAAKTASTGGLPVVWSKTLLTTAGMFRYHWRTTPSGRRIVTDARIELAEKVCDDERRLYSTLAHEFAHAADLIVSENWSGRSHGRGFTAWLKKAKAAFPEKDIEVGACHDYEISYKYHWHCAGKGGAMGGGGGCGYVVKRHSKSVNTERHRCPGCLGRLVQVLPAPKGSGAGRGSGGEDGEKGSSEYQRFMKKRFAEIKKRNPGMQQKELMKIVGKEWRERKASNGDTNWFEETGKSGVSEVVEISDDDEDDDDDDEEYDEREKEASSRLEGVFGDLRLGTCEN